MDAPTTILGGAMWTVSLAMTMLTQWVPATLASIISPVMPGSSISQIGVISDPVTPQQFLQYLATVSAPGMYDKFVHVGLIALTVILAWCLLFGTVLVYSAVRFFQTRLLERRRFYTLAHPVAGRDAPRMQLRWQQVLSEMRGGSEQGWRNAILEADLLLKELLDTLGYQGEAMADQMKKVNVEDFKSIDAAWEAHHLRMRLMEHTTEKLTAAEARHCIDLYAQVFKEFKFIR